HIRLFPHRSYHYPGHPGFRPGNELASAFVHHPASYLPRSKSKLDGRLHANQRLIRIFLFLSGAIGVEKQNPDSTPSLWFYVRRLGKTGTGDRLLSRHRGINVTYCERTLSEMSLKAFDSLTRKLISDDSHASLSQGASRDRIPGHGIF